MLDGPSFAVRASSAGRVMIDLGTGDGRFVLHAARRDPACLVIGVDACRENLYVSSRTAPVNALFVIANALTLPSELSGSATQITINFPWGSLLTGLLAADGGLLHGLRMIARPRAALELRLNRSALTEAGVTPAEAGVLIRRALREAGFSVEPTVELDAAALRALPSAWAKRLAYGREPHALYLQAAAPGAVQHEPRWSGEAG
jgi:16S rRNA (adenine(1408)-N(1))-methyltransferase